MLKMTGQLLFLGSPLLLVAIAQGFCIKHDLLQWFKKPIDLGLTFKGKRVFGDNKTWRGLVINIVFCVIGTSIQSWLQKKAYLPSWLPLLDYNESGWQLGLLLGAGMTIGELPNSFLKRQMGISPGKKGSGLMAVPFFLLDQVDLVIGIWAFIFFLVKPSFALILWSLWIAFILHMIVSIIGYGIGMRKTVV
jgi:CDP-diglyceride synthetase